MTSQLGMSLVEVMAAAGIMLVVLGGVISAQLIMMRENRALGEKLAALDFQRVITKTLASNASCDLLITKSGNVLSGSLSFNPSAVAYPYVINLRSIPESAAADIVSQTNPLISPLSNSLRIRATGGIQISIPNATDNPTLNIHFGSGVRDLKSLSFPLPLETTTVGTTRTILGCQSGVGVAGGHGLKVFTTSGSWTVPDGVTSVKVSAVGGGGGGAGLFIYGGAWVEAAAGSPSSLQGCAVVGGGGGRGTSTTSPFGLGTAGVGGTGSGGTMNWSGGSGTVVPGNSGQSPTPGASASALFGIPFLGIHGGGGVLTSDQYYNGGCWRGFPGGAGGGGGAAIGSCAVTPGQSLTVTVGAGGANAKSAGGCPMPATNYAPKGAVVIEW